jgi:hypothetical protein
VAAVDRLAAAGGGAADGALLARAGELVGAARPADVAGREPEASPKTFPNWRFPCPTAIFPMARARWIWLAACSLPFSDSRGNSSAIATTKPIGAYTP